MQMQGLDIMGLKERPRKDDSRLCSGDVWCLHAAHAHQSESSTAGGLGAAANASAPRPGPAMDA